MTAGIIILARCLLFQKSFHGYKETLETLAPWPMDNPTAGVQRKGKMQISRSSGAAQDAPEEGRAGRQNILRRIDSLDGVAWIMDKLTALSSGVLHLQKAWEASTNLGWVLISGQGSGLRQ